MVGTPCITKIQAFFDLVWPRPSVTELVASRPTRVDFIGICMIAWVPVALIEGAANRKHQS
jgi:hypothetical protein